MSKEMEVLAGDLSLATRHRKIPEGAIVIDPLNPIAYLEVLAKVEAHPSVPVVDEIKAGEVVVCINNIAKLKNSEIALQLTTGKEYSVIRTGRTAKDSHLMIMAADDKGTDTWYRASRFKKKETPTAEVKK